MTQPDDIHEQDAQIVDRLTAEVRGALAYLRAGQGYGTITVRLLLVLK